jgi:hypothetical protein
MRRARGNLEIAAVGNGGPSVGFPAITKSTRHSKITGDFAELLVLYWLSRDAWECTRVVHRFESGTGQVCRPVFSDALQNPSPVQLGPRSGERGKRPLVRGTRKDMFHLRPRRREYASMGRVRENAESRIRRKRRGDKTHASMGPRSGERGKPAGDGCPWGLDCASMGPRSGERGKFAVISARSKPRKLQWGRVRENAERSLWRTAPVKSSPLLQWGRVRENAESRHL